MSRIKHLCSHSHRSIEQESGQDQKVQKCDTPGSPRRTIADLVLRISPGDLHKTLKEATALKEALLGLRGCCDSGLKFLTSGCAYHHSRHSCQVLCIDTSLLGSGLRAFLALSRKRRDG